MKRKWNELAPPSFFPVTLQFALSSRVLLLPPLLLHFTQSLYACVSSLSLPLRDSTSLSARKWLLATHNSMCSRRNHTLQGNERLTNVEWNVGNKERHCHWTHCCVNSPRNSHDWVTDRLTRPAGLPASIETELTWHQHQIGSLSELLSNILSTTQLRLAFLKRFY